MAVCGTAWTALTNCYVTFREGSAQFGLAPKVNLFPARGYVVAFYLISLPIIASAFAHSLHEESAHFWPLLAAAFAGLLAGTYPAYGVGRSLGLAPELPATHALVLGNPWLLGLVVSDFLIQRMARREAFKRQLRAWRMLTEESPVPQEELPERARAVYRRLAASEVPRGLYLLLALSAMLTSAALYAALFVVRRQLPIPALAYVLILLMLLCWCSPGCPSGWTARVLTGLEEECRAAFPNDPKIFGDSIRLISAVSGGSIGAMYFADEYDPQGGGLPADRERLEAVVSRSEGSSLDEIGWALAYVDVWRPLFPFFRNLDRGVALEAPCKAAPMVWS